MTKEELKQKRKETAAKLLKKLLLDKMRSHMKEMKANVWTYYNYR